MSMDLLFVFGLLINVLAASGAAVVVVAGLGVVGFFAATEVVGV